MNIYEKINAIMESVESLQKDGKVAFNTTKYNYLSESKTTAEMRKQLVKHKLVILPIGVQEEIKGSITQGKYTYKLVNAENPEEFIILESGGQGHDSADKGSGKASSYAYKYLMWRTFAIPSNDDPDQISSDEITEQEKAEKAPIDQIKVKAIKELIINTSSDESMLCTFYNIKKIEDMNMETYVKAIARLEKKGRTK